MKRLLTAVLVLCLASLAGCAKKTYQLTEADEYLASFENPDHAAIARALDDDDAWLDEAYDTQLIADPLESWNRAVFVFNDGMITYVAKPLNTAYTTVTPRVLREGLYNVFHNAAFPVRFVNNLLQGKGHEAGLEFSRFIINTGAGLGGFFDVASRHEEFHVLDQEDFGQTMAVWGVGEGFYLYWPFLGPSNPRDTMGLVGDYFLNPVSYVQPDSLSWSLWGVKVFTQLDGIIDTYEDVTNSSIEPYTAVRDAYVQYRRAKVAK